MIRNLLSRIKDWIFRFFSDDGTKKELKDLLWSIVISIAKLAKQFE